MNKIQRFILSMIVIAIVSVSLPALACDAMGPNRHVVVVSKIDPKAGTFTIIDAQMQKPLTFTAQEQILEVLKLNQSIIITFRMDGQRMKAEAVVPVS